MQILLTGATGLVGGGVLHHILSLSPAVASTKHIHRVSVLQRKPEVPLLKHADRPVENTFTQVNVVEHSDFSTYPESLLAKLKSSSSGQNVDDENDKQLAVIWALGMSQNDAKSPEQYVEVTQTYAVSAAKALATAWAPNRVNFVYVSGEGATKAPGMMTPMFGKVKGATEQELLALTTKPEYSNLRVYNVRPAAVDPVNQSAINALFLERLKDAPAWRRGLLKAVFPVLRAGVWSSNHSPTEDLGKVFVGLGIGDGKALKGPGMEDGGWTVRNIGLRRLAKEMS